MARRKPTAMIQLKVRMRETLRARLAGAADKREHSLNAEAVERLQQSFNIEDRLGGVGMVELIETIAHVMKLTGEQAGFFATGKLANHGKWTTLPYAFDQAMRAAVAVMEHYRPPGDVVAPQPRVVVMGVGNTKVDREESVRRTHEALDNLGELMALSEIRKKEQDDE
ncbi:MAG: Arc family DNA-binding protein [Gammaproteobacteria bacterium]|nr:Arc family DNA-binding protein [Gammaproteobacteria bacterium]